jgi:predicted nucleic acid-binding Zn ribbon protein
LSRRRKKPRDIEPMGMVLDRDRLFRQVLEGPAPPVSKRDWEVAVGTRIAARTRPTRLERGVLHVVVSSAAWAQELSLLAATIAEQLRARGLDVGTLRFSVGRLEPEARPPRRPKKRAPPDAPLPPEVRRSLSSVEDDELRAAIERAAHKSLGWIQKG